MGTAAIILIVALGITGRAFVMRQIEGVGSNLVWANYRGTVAAGTVPADGRRDHGRGTCPPVALDPTLLGSHGDSRVARERRRAIAGQEPHRDRRHGGLRDRAQEHAGAEGPFPRRGRRRQPRAASPWSTGRSTASSSATRILRQDDPYARHDVPGDRGVRGARGHARTRRRGAGDDPDPDHGRLVLPQRPGGGNPLRRVARLRFPAGGRGGGLRRSSASGTARARSTKSRA